MELTTKKRIAREITIIGLIGVLTFLSGGFLDYLNQRALSKQEVLINENIQIEDELERLEQIQMKNPTLRQSESINTLNQKIQRNNRIIETTKQLDTFWISIWILSFLLLVAYPIRLLLAFLFRSRTGRSSWN